MKFVIKPSGPFFKPSPWRLLSSPGSKSKLLLHAGQTARYIIIEVCKTRDQAAHGDKIEDFATNNEKVRKQGPGFSLPRLLSGQVTIIYALEFTVDRQQIYVAAALNKVGTTYSCLCGVLFWWWSSWCWSPVCRQFGSTLGAISFDLWLMVGTGLSTLSYLQWGALLTKILAIWPKSKAMSSA